MNVTSETDKYYGAQPESKKIFKQIIIKYKKYNTVNYDITMYVYDFEVILIWNLISTGKGYRYMLIASISK